MSEASNDEPPAGGVTEPATRQDPMRLFLLGRFEVRSGERVLIDRAWPRRKAQALLKLLALQPGRSLHREQLYEHLWPGLPPGAAPNNLHQALHHLRSAFHGESPVAITGDTVTLSAHASLDTDRFQALASAALEASGEPEPKEEALAAYAGDLLPDDLYEDWTLAPRRRLHDVRHRLLIELAQLYEASGSVELAVERYQQAVNADPGHEGAHQGLMRLYARMGDRDRALHQYRTCVESLRAELAAEPSPETEALYRSIAEGRLSASAKAPGSPDPPVVAAADGAPAAASRRRWWSRRHPWLSAGALALAVGAIAVTFVFFHIYHSHASAATMRQIRFSHIGRSVGTITGDCVNENVRAKGDYTGNVTGDITGSIAGGGEGEYYAATKCTSAELLTTYTITDTGGNQLFITEDYRGDVQATTAGSGQKIMVRVNFPVANETITGGTGAYKSATGNGTCNLRTTGEMTPGSTAYTSYWQSDCTLRIKTQHPIPAATNATQPPRSATP